jgi:hypothetical protein
MPHFAQSRQLAVWLLVLASLSCTSPTGPTMPVGQVQLPAALIVAEVGIASEFTPSPIYLTLHNISSDSTAMLYGHCSFAIRGYASAERIGPPRWVHLLPTQSHCTADVALVLPVQAQASSFHNLGSVSAGLLSRGAHLTLTFQVSGEDHLREVPIIPIAVDFSRRAP